jgi:hypothetical protein
MFSCLAAGMNSNIIANGPVASVTFATAGPTTAENVTAIGSGAANDFVPQVLLPAASRLVSTLGDAPDWPPTRVSARRFGCGSAARGQAGACGGLEIRLDSGVTNAAQDAILPTNLWFHMSGCGCGEAQLERPYEGGIDLRGYGTA